MRATDKKERVLKCEKFVRAGTDKSVRCPYDAKWRVRGHAGTIMIYCGLHALSWRKAYPKQVQPIQVSEP
jgi:hypothetical protein